MIAHEFRQPSDNLAQSVAEEVGRQEVTADWLYNNKDAGNCANIYMWHRDGDEAYGLSLEPWRLNPDMWDRAEKNGHRLFVQLCDLPERYTVISQIRRVIRRSVHKTGYMKGRIGEESTPIYVWAKYRDDLDRTDELNGYVIKEACGATVDGVVTEFHVGLATISYEDLPLEDLKLVLQWLKDSIDEFYWKYELER